MSKVLCKFGNRFTSSVLTAIDHKTFFTNAVLLHANGLNRFALSLCHNHQDAEDLVQDTVLKAYENLARLKDQTKIKSWLYRILYNQFVSHYRKKCKINEVDLPDADDKSFSLFKNLTTTGTEDPEKSFLQKLTSATIQKAIDELRPAYKQALVLSDIEEFSYREIAHILEVPIGTVRSRIARARQQLEKSLWSLASEMGFGKGKMKDANPYVCTCGKDEAVITNTSNASL